MRGDFGKNVLRRLVTIFKKTGPGPSRMNDIPEEAFSFMSAKLWIMAVKFFDNFIPDHR